MPTNQTSEAIRQVESEQALLVVEVPNPKNLTKLYADEENFPGLQPILSRPINWDLIARQYDEMVKYATALRLGTAETEAILRRFTRDNLKHPTYQALLELGKVKRTMFLCRYLPSEALRQEVQEALNVVERWNGTNSFIFFGKGGEVATNRLDDQEVSVLSLHLPHLCSAERARASPLMRPLRPRAAAAGPPVPGA